MRRADNEEFDAENMPKIKADKPACIMYRQTVEFLYPFCNFGKFGLYLFKFQANLIIFLVDLVNVLGKLLGRKNRIGSGHESAYLRIQRFA
jgi:hypothetical protein